MSEFKTAREEYEKIIAGETLKERVENTMKKTTKRVSPFAKILAGAACFCVVCVGALNASPQLAYALSEVPVIRNIVQVVTFGRYEYKDGGYIASVVTPKIEGLLDEELSDRLNAEFAENADYVIAAFEQDVKEFKEEFGDEIVNMSIRADYIVKTDTDDVLAIDAYIVNEVGSSSTKHSYYNINKKTGELLSLSGMFKEGADYITPISEYIKGEMKRRNTEENTSFWIAGEGNSFEGFDKIDAEQGFYINANGNIVICFEKYEVAPGYMSSPEFELPQSVVNDILK